MGPEPKNIRNGWGQLLRMSTTKVALYLASAMITQGLGAAQVDGGGNSGALFRAATPYLDQQFSTSLTPHEKSQLLTFARAGRCDLVARLEAVGLIRRARELAPFLTSNDDISTFANTLLTRHSHHYRYCIAKRKLHDVLYRNVTVDWHDSNHHGQIVGIAQGFEYLRDQVFFGRFDAARHPLLIEPVTADDIALAVRVRDSFAIHFKLAFCDDFKPAIADVLEMTFVRRSFTFLADDAARYLARKAEQHGIRSPVVATILQKAPPARYVAGFSMIDRAFKGNDLDTAKSVISELLVICAHPDEWKYMSRK